jgi:transformation/transcription domain-associated protein
MVDAGKSLCTLIKMVFTAFPLDSPTTPQEVKILHQRVADLLQKNLAAVTTPQISLEAANVNPIISFALSVMKAVSEVQKNFIDHFIGLLLRALQRLVRDMGTSSLHSRQVGFFLVTSLGCKSYGWLI